MGACPSQGSPLPAKAVTDMETQAAIERPVGANGAVAAFGSDVVAQTLRALDISYIALNPGASFRGLHDSLVNHLGNERPTMLLCLHEEHAVAIAQGYAKVTGRAMAAAVHSNVGLFHASMAIFNAWCDRMPVIVLGATGPVDASRRRPWIDWIHTARDQASVIRHFVKWDDQPASPGAAREALLRAAWIAQTTPMGPVYINLDAGMQEARIEEPLAAIDHARFIPRAETGAPADLLKKAALLLAAAERPVLLVGRVSRSVGAWQARIALAERLGAKVATDLKVGAGFPTDHPLHAGAPGIYAGPQAQAAIRAADVILSLDWVDLGGTLQAAFGSAAPPAKIIQVSLDHVNHNGWSMDYQALPPADLFFALAPEPFTAALLEELGAELAIKAPGRPLPAQRQEIEAAPAAGAAGITVDQLGLALKAALGERESSLLHLPLSWNGAIWPFRHPLDFIGSDGGGGIGAGPGISVGAALALRDSGRLPIGILGDGDFVMGVTALWTAVHYRIPMLIVVANNQSFFNDEVHQERVARMRERPVENRWIGMRMTDPELDLVQLARAQGALGFGPVKSADDLTAVFLEAIAAVAAGAVAVVDVRVLAGYTPALATPLTRSAS